jgi:hypothetical protein
LGAKGREHFESWTTRAGAGEIAAIAAAAARLGQA